MDMQLMLTNLHSTRALPWNNLEELSSLWTVFTKCKRQLRNGFRLENMTWRLWYRQAVMGKQTRPGITTEPDLTPVTTTSFATPRLSRSRSLPDLSIHYAHHSHPLKNPNAISVADKSPMAITATSSKFYIDQDDDGTIGDNSMYDESYWATNTTTFSSSQSSIITDEDDTIADVEATLFTKQEIPCPAATGPKPASLLSKMFQQGQQQTQAIGLLKKTHSSVSIAGSLRRCKSRFAQLDEWFSAAV